MKHPGKSIKPQRDYILAETEREMMDTYVLAEAVEHARRLRNEIPYSMLEVKPVVSAYHIRRLISIIHRLVASKGVARVRRLEWENKELQREAGRTRWGEGGVHS